MPKAWYGPGATRLWVAAGKWWFELGRTGKPGDPNGLLQLLAHLGMLILADALVRTVILQG